MNEFQKGEHKRQICVRREPENEIRQQIQIQLQLQVELKIQIQIHTHIDL